MKRATLLAAAILLAALLGCAARTGPKSGAGPLPIGENSRTSDPRIENRRWELIELNGRQIEPPSDRAGAYLRLDATESRVTGNASCNRFFGTYELLAGDRIRFGPDIGSTKMACPELEQEREFLDTLGRVDNYSVGEGGLSLNRARMAPLARFREAPPKSGD